MLDFVKIIESSPKKDVREIYPDFLVQKSQDLMIRGKDFYAVWDDERKLWSTDEYVLIELVDAEIRNRYEEVKSTTSGELVKPLYLRSSNSKQIDKWHRYCKSHMADFYQQLDNKIIFANQETKRSDYASHKLDYSLEAGSFDAWEELVSTLYDPPERLKIEWCIGAIVSGDSKKLQKFMVIYGEPGSGKSTILNIIAKLFDGYVNYFDAKALGSNNESFALEMFKGNPLVSIQHDGDLSRIEDNTRINSIASHETMTINEKHKSLYSQAFNTFMIMGTNKPVQISDSRSGLLRRLIDVEPSGRTLSRARYDHVMSRVDFELGAIAFHCLSVYQADPHRFDSYIPVGMLSRTNDFYNFIVDHWDEFAKTEGISASYAYDLYKKYAENCNMAFVMSMKRFRSELSVYFKSWEKVYTLKDGTIVWDFYKDFRKDKFEIKEEEKESETASWVKLDNHPSIFDIEFKDCPAQYADEMRPWDDVVTMLRNIRTSKLHYILVPGNLIVIDLDLKGPDGEKSLERNLEMARAFPPTYAEVSKSGKALHLHYIYDGDPEELAREYAKDIEIKVFTGHASLRRCLTLCNDLPINHISSGLPKKEKGVRKSLDFNEVKSEMGLRKLIGANLEKRYHPGTKPSIDFIFKILDDAYNSDLKYDVTDMRGHVLNFAMGSTHQAKYCVDKVAEMQFKSADPPEEGGGYDKDGVLVFFDVEVFPNLFVVVYKPEGKPCVTMINPSKESVGSLLKMKLVGFNNRKYDNHILYAAWQGYSNYELYKLSKRLISNDRNATFGAAYNISYTDILDFSAKKQSLKKFEMDLDILHDELGYSWDDEVPPEKWERVAEYCRHDVEATEKVFYDRADDFKARCILADIAGGTPNDTTNSLTTRIIFGMDRKPQREFNYRDMSKPVRYSEALRADFGEDYIFHVFDENGEPTYSVYDGSMELPEGWSVLPFFPGYTYDAGVSMYKGEKIGEGGRVYAELGAYGDVALLDIASQHPHSIIAEQLFGPVYTKRFSDIVNLRILIKHSDFETAKTLLDGALIPYLTGDVDPSALALALKIAINSVYGLTKAGFENPFRDLRNKDNIVAKRGALFMTNLKEQVQKRGFSVAHIKTDSIKIPDATPEIIDFVYKYGLEYGYKFEHEASYEKMCLSTKADYVAQYMPCEKCEEKYGYIPGDNLKAASKGTKWTATADGFKVPYVFKPIFSHEDMVFKDYCFTKTSKTALYLDFNEEILTEIMYEHGFSDFESENLDGDVVYKALRSIKVPKREAEAIISDPYLHDYKFIGKVGSFCPVLPGFGGGVLVRSKDDGGFASAGGALGYRWMEPETVKKLGMTDKLDMRYFEEARNEAKATIEQYCDFEWFISDDPYNGEIVYVWKK